MYMYQYICMSITVECTNVSKHFMIQTISPTEICILFAFSYTTCMHEYGIKKKNMHIYIHTYKLLMIGMAIQMKHEVSFRIFEYVYTCI